MPPSYEELAAASPDAVRIDRFVIAVTAAAFLLRLLVALAVWHAHPATWLFSQASELGELSHSVATGHGLSSPFGVDTGHSAFLPPGYPLFIGLVFAALGSFSRSSELAILIVQACFGSAAVFFAVLFARRMFGRITANATGILLAFHPWIIALGIVFWETSLSLMLLAALLLTVFRWRARPTTALSYIAAVLGAVAIAVNASLALTVLALLVWAAWQRRTSRHLLVPGLVFVVLCSLWPVRNAFSMHAFIPLRDNLGYELWQGNRSGADGFFAPELHPNTNSSELRRFASQGELRYMREKSTIAKKTILHNPRRFASLTGKRVLCFWAGISRQTYANQIVIASLTSLLGFAGLFRYVKRRGWKPALPAILPLVLFPAPYYITHPDFRFWCLLSPLLTALAVYTFTSKADATRESPI